MFIRRFAMFMASVCILAVPAFAWANPAPSRIDASEAGSGIVKVQHDPTKTLVEKVMISKDNQNYYYSVLENNRFPLQLGDGAYTVSLLQYAGDNKYRMVENKVVNVTATQPLAVFVQPIQTIYWNDTMNPIVKANELTKDLTSDREKVTAIYNYVTQLVQYDYAKANVVSSDYIPSIEATWNEKQGICYDYASLFAAMLRSQGIPTKLVMGRKSDIPQYHAWNEVYLKETNEWVTIDTTYDSIMLKGTKKPSMIKDKAEYTIEKQY